MKETFVAFIDEKIKRDFESLKGGKFEDEKLFGFIKRAISDLKENPACGAKIQKDRWPKRYIQDYQITNLWKYDLPNGWRLLYTVTPKNEVELISAILEWFNHKEYERRFGY